MQQIEPFYHWRELYRAENDERSPFYEREYSEMYYSNAVYNHVIHPQWDEFGSNTLYLKILYTDYHHGFTIIELIGEWNDCINNDIMFFKREVIDYLVNEGVSNFILVGENILNFHGDGDDYYEEWYEDIEDGWIAALNFRPHILEQFKDYNIDYYLNYGGELDEINWRALSPPQLYKKVENIMRHRLY